MFLRLFLCPNACVCAPRPVMLAAPQAERAMVVGRFRVPLETKTFATEGGAMENHDMVFFRHPAPDVTGRQQLAGHNRPWCLWQMLGVEKPQSHGRKWSPLDVHLVKEIKQQIVSRRKKRLRKGGWKDVHGGLVPALIKIEIRGKKS